MKCNEMLFEIIYIYIHCGLYMWFQCYTGEGVKIHQERAHQENRKSRGDSNSIMDKAHAILSWYRSLFLYSLVFFL